MAEDQSYLFPLQGSISEFSFKIPLGATKKNLLPIFDDILEDPKEDVVKVYLRIRPVAGIKRPSIVGWDDHQLTMEAPDDSTTYKNDQHHKKYQHKFVFTKIFAPDADQRHIFEECVLEPVKNFIRGEDGLFFTYGTTNAGKTYTIQGTVTKPGIIPRALHLLFASIKGRVNAENHFKLVNGSSLIVLDNSSALVELEYKQTILNKSFDTESIDTQSSLTETSSRSSEMEEFISSTFREMQHHLHKEQDSTFIKWDRCDMNFSVFVSFAEIYNENLYDLLEPPMDVLRRHRDGPKKRSLQFGRDLKGNTYIKGLRQIKVSSGDEAFQVLLFGQNNLQFASTELNSVSSRSHCIFSIILVRHADTEDPVITTINTFSFCDLAGTERAKKTHNVGERLKESQNINTSLLVLGRCLKAIRHNQKTKDKCIVPFRDSKLTQLFRQPLLSKNSSVAMIVNINPDPHIFDETITVLKFSAVAMEILLPPRKRKPMRESRFSIHIKKCSQSRTTNSSETSQTSQGSYHTAQIEQLMNLVEHYKARAHEERQRNYTLEQDLRNEMADQASAMVAQVQQEWEDRHLRLGQAQEELAKWRLERLEEGYEKELKKCRMAQTKSQSHDTEQMAELQTQLDDLKARCSEMEQENRMLKELRIQSSKETQDLEVEVSRLKFQLSANSQDLTNAKKLLVAQMNDDSSSIAFELKLQLETERKTNLGHSTKIKELNETLESAKEDFQILTNERNELEEQLEISEKYVALKGEELKDLSAQLRSCRSKLLEQSQHLDGKDETIAKLNLHCHELEEEIKALKQTVVTNQECLSESRRNLKKSENKCQDFETTIEEQKSSLEEWGSKCRYYETIIEEQKSSLEEWRSKCRNYETIIEEHKSSLEEWRSKCQNYETIIEEQKSPLEEWGSKCQSYETIIEEQKSSLEEWGSKCQNYETIIEEQKSSLEEWGSKCHNYETIIEEQKLSLEEWGSKCQNYETIIEEQKSSLEEWESKCQDIEATNLHLLQRVEELGRSVQDLESVVKEYDVESCYSHKDRALELERSLTELECRLKETNASYQDSQEKIEILKMTLKESESSRLQSTSIHIKNVSVLEISLAECKSQLKDLKDSHKDSLEKVKGFEKELVESESLIRSLRQQVLDYSEEKALKEAALAEQDAKLRDLETSEQVYMAKVEDLEKTLEDLNSRLETVKLVHEKKREEEIKTLQKEVKNLLQYNLSMKEELEGKTAEVTRLEQEIKSLQASGLCDDTKQLYSNYEVQVESLKVQLQAYKEEGILAEVFRSEVNKKTQEIERLKEENEQMHQEIDFHAQEMEQLKSRRDQQFKAYEDLLKNAREETEREKKELSHFQEILYKTTPNSLRKESHAQLEQLRREIDDKDRELSYYKEKVAKQEERVKKYQKELMSRSETFKQPLERAASTTRIPTPASSRRPLRTQLDENSSARRSSRQKKKCVKKLLSPPMAVSSDFEELSEEKGKKKSSRRKLYSHTDEEVHLSGINLQEPESTVHSPNTMMKHNLRTRRM